MDRERLLDMEERIKPVRALTMGMLALILVVSGPWLGWWTLAPLALAAGFFHLADRRLEASDRPEYVMFAAWAGSELMISAAVFLSGGPATATICWLAIPVVTLSARFSGRGVILGVCLAVALTLAVAFGRHPGEVLDNPPLVLAPVALIVAVALLSTALMRSDLQHRSESVIDPLTGMLNRKALSNRVGELRQQAELTGQPIGLILGDLDNFKLINDNQGHAAGDAALKDLTYMFRKRLRAFDLAYRIGGEEFLILLPGATLTECAEVAEDLRLAVATERFGEDSELTISFGVSASSQGDGFDYDRVFAAADEALYEAKSLGRNRVCEGARPRSASSASVQSEPAGVAASSVS